MHAVENYGVVTILTRADDLLSATVPAHTELAIDEAVRFMRNPEKAFLFDQAIGESPRPRAVDFFQNAIVFIYI